MSKPTMIQAQCPHCEADIEVPYYEDVNVVDHPDLKEAILSGDFFKYTCPHCQETIPVVGPLLYHDPSVPLMVYYAPQGFDEASDKLNEMLEMISGMEGDRASLYKARIVNSIDKLLEKIYIFDAGMDDRIVELVKLAYLKHYAGDLKSKGRIRATIYMPDSEQNDAQVVFMFGDEGGMASVDFSKDYYAYFGTEFAEALKEGDVTNKFIKIDEHWAAQFIKEQQA